METEVMNKLTFSVCTSDYPSIGSKALEVKKKLKDFFPKSDYLRRLGVCIFEAEANLVIHTNQGGNLEILVFKDRVRIIASDRGPGIKDLSKALTPGFSTAPESARQLGFGGGVGINNIKRFADYFFLTSSKQGTILLFEVWNDDDKANT
jgi:serine/threonine-protein kinase RsbT